MSDQQDCDLCGDQGPLLLKAKCHLTAPLAVTLDGDVLIVRCYLPACGREVARFNIVRPGNPSYGRCSLCGFVSRANGTCSRKECANAD